MPKQRDLKRLRARLGESQAAFAKRFGVDQATIHRWEKNGGPKRGPAKVGLDKLLDAIFAEAAE